MWDQNRRNIPTLKSFELVKQEWAQLIIHNWDFLNNWDDWDKIVTKYLWPNFPVIWTAWNHDLIWKGHASRHVGNGWSDFQKIFKRRMNANPDLKCNWDLWKKSVCTFKGIKIITVSPWLTDQNFWSYIRNNLKNDNHIWRICHWHKTMPEMQVWPKTSRDVWRDVFEAARENWCITTIWHDHSYARTYLLGNMQKQTVIWKKSPYLIKPGQIIHLLVWSSGMWLYKRGHNIKNWLWEVIYSKEDGDKWKWVLFCSFKWRKADCYFKSVTWQVLDRFSLISWN
jgi:hypothetical protein